MPEALGLTNKFNWKNCAPFGNCNILIRRRNYCVWSNVTGLIEPPKACLIKDLKSSIWQPIKTRKSWKQLFLILSVLCFQVHYVWTHYIQHRNEVLDKAMSTIVLFSGQITCDIRVVRLAPTVPWKPPPTLCRGSFGGNSLQRFPPKLPLYMGGVSTPLIF